MKKYSFKSNKCTPSREVLDQYVFDYGEDSAQAYFNLSEAKYNSIMYDKITTKLPERFQWVEPTPNSPEVPELSKDFNKLKNYICKHFKSILEQHKATDSKKIDARSMSAYDRAMEVLTNLLYYNSDFIFISENATKDYIGYKMDNGLSTERWKACKAEHLLAYNDEVDTETYQDYSAEDVSNITRRLNGREAKVVTMLTEGYKQDEIATELQVDQSTVSRSLKIIRNNIESAA